MSSSAPIDRRSFLAGALKAGVGIGLGTRALGRSGAPRAPEVSPGPVVRTEPRLPPAAVGYVSRPDLAPVGVTVNRSAAFAASASARSYVFCAPKSPLFASPRGAARPARHAFPPGATPGLMILDTSGELVWFKPMPTADDIPFNFRVQSYKGKPTLTWFQGRVHDAHGDGHYVLADDTYNVVATVRSTRYPADLHEFILTPEGTALHSAYEQGPAAADGVPLFIGHAQEVDVATNELLFDWSCYPEIPTHLSYVQPFPTYFDYFHINSIDLWPGTERNLLISARNTSAVYLVDRRTKSVTWRLGGKQSDFTLGPGVDFYYQHDARSLPDGSGISLFDDASQPAPETVASGKVIALDESARTATLVERCLHSDGEIRTPSQGNCQLLADGGHVVGWGYLPFFSVYAPAVGQLDAPLILDGRFPAGAASYRTFLFDWVGNPPLSELSLVVRPTHAPGSFRAFVSWNGATEVVAWQLLAGAQAGSVAPAATARKSGFETAIDFVSDGARAFQVRALDVSGSVIGQSPVVASDPTGGSGRP